MKWTVHPEERIPVTKLYILQEIKRTTQTNGDRPLGKLQFEAETGIKRYDRFGVYWARWSDALRKAVLESLHCRPRSTLANSTQAGGDCAGAIPVGGVLANQANGVGRSTPDK